MKTFRVPDLAEGLEEVEIVTWHVSAGDRVVGGQPLVSVETDKAVVEVTAPQAGLVAKTFGSAGDRLKVGAPLLEFDGEGRADTGTVVGEIPSEPAAAAAHLAQGGRQSPATGIRAAPAVRALARRLDVELADVSPTGPEESITVADVEHASRDRGTSEGFEPLRGVRLAMARNMARAHEQVVPATLYSDADVQAWGADTDVMIRLIQAVAAGCAAEPALNAWLRGSDLALRVHDHVHLAVAIDTEHGLFAPVLRDAEGKSEAQLRNSLDVLREQAESRTLAPESLRGATFTLSNFGSLGGRYAALVVVPPQVGILGAGRARSEVVPVGGAPVVGRRLPLSLTFDHRAVTGAEATRFLAAVIAHLEKPA